MRLIGHLSDETRAQAFGDFLLARGVRNEIERDGDRAWSVWVLDENQVETARTWFSQYERDPGAAEFREAAATAARIREEEAKEAAAYRRRVRTSQTLFPSSRAYGAGYVTYALIVVCVAIGLYSGLGENVSFLRPFFINDPESGTAGFLPQVRAGEIWRLFTPALIHFGPLHLLFNMLWLFQLGSMIESRQGHLRFALLTLGLAAGSNVAQYATYGPDFGGMSGVVYGLFGYIWIRGRMDPASGLWVHRNTVVLLIAWFFLCLTGWVGHVANMAHGAGLILGGAYGYVSAVLARREG
jgi:GlpG protein